MRNYQEDFIILHNLSIKGRPSQSPSIIQFIIESPSSWMDQSSYIDGAARDAPRKSSCGWIFQTCRGFVKGFFTIFLGNKFAFEVEIFEFMIVVETTHRFG